MKFIGPDVVKNNKGYFGVRRCSKCNELKEVNLLELKGVVRFFFLPVKTYITKRYLVCNTCQSVYEITNEQWNYYSTYLHNRLDKKTTNNVLDTLTKINNTFVDNGTFIDITKEIYHPSIDSIYEELIKKYGHKETLEELISVFFSNELDKNKQTK